VHADSEHEWEALDPGNVSDVVGDLAHTVPVVSEVPKRKPTRTSPVYVPGAKAIVGPDTVVPTAPSSLVTPARERTTTDLPITPPATVLRYSRDFATQSVPATTDAATQTLPSTGIEVTTQTEGTKRRRLDWVQKTYQVGGQSVIKFHEDKEWF
jgi:hypothetical protein